MGIIRIIDGPTFALDSYGNGWAYKLWRRDVITRSVWLQGDAATEFRALLGNLENSLPGTPTEKLLGALWNDFEYGLLSERDEETAEERA